MDFAQQLVNGVQIGSVYALVAIGYTMVYGIAKMINFAHGDIIMVGSYVALLFFQSSGLPVWGVIAATAAVSAVLGVTIERLAYKPLRGGSRMSALITTIGVSLMLQNGFLLIFGSSPKPFPNHFTGEGFTLGGVTVSRLTAITLVVTVVLMVLLTLFVNRTRVGKAMRAVSEDQGAAQLMGINIDTSISITFAIGSALAAVAAVLYSSTYPLINPYMFDARPAGLYRGGHRRHRSHSRRHDRRLHHRHCRSAHQALYLVCHGRRHRIRPAHHRAAGQAFGSAGTQ